MMMIDGVTTPSVAESAPSNPYQNPPNASPTVVPVYVAMLTAKGPGVLSDMAMKSMSTLSLIQPSATTSCMMRGIIACPPPIVNRPILKKTQNRRRNTITQALLHLCFQLYFLPQQIHLSNLL